MPPAVTDFDRVRRFMCYGSDSSLLVVGETHPVKENASCIGRLIGDGKGEEVVQEIVRCYVENKYIHATLIFTLAYCFKSTDNNTKTAARKAAANICKLPTDLFYFVEFSKMMSDQHKGWGRSLRTLVCNWYNGKDPMELLDLVTRFKSGCAWSHVDVLRLSHTCPAKDETAIIIRYLMKGIVEAKKLATDMKSSQINEILKYLEAVEMVKRSTDEHQIARLIEQYNLKKEHVPTALYNSQEIWLTIVKNISITDILNNIIRLAGLGILNNGHHLLPDLIKRLTTEEIITESGVSPMSVLVALKNYEHGKGKVKWTRNEDVVLALNVAFAFAIKNNVTVTNKRCLIAIKISHGMPQISVRGTASLSSMMAAAGLATIFNRSEENCSVVFFSSAVTPVTTTRQMGLLQVCEGIAQAALPEIPVLACDVSAPIRWAMDTKKCYDAIIILTDSKYSTGSVTPSSALQQYRKDIKLPNVKLVVCGMTSKKLSFADSNDSGMLDIAGFDATVPDAISNFISDM